MGDSNQNGFEEFKERKTVTSSNPGVVPDLTSQIDSLSLKKSETEYRSDFYKTKKKFKSDGVYIFKCKDCSLFLMLHQEFCPHCNNQNVYYDDSLEVSEQVH